MGALVQQGATVQCAHGGQAQPSTPAPRVSLAGQKAVALPSPWTVSGCTLPPQAGGPCATATWTSGDVVMTAVTDGSRETLAAAVAALPHEARQQPTTMERVRAGWSRILGR